MTAPDAGWSFEDDGVRMSEEERRRVWRIANHVPEPLDLEP